MPYMPLLMVAALSAAAGTLDLPISWTVVAEGTLEQLAVAKAELTRCRFSRIDIAATGAGQGQLRVPAAEMRPRSAVCLNHLADTLGLQDVRWSGSDLRKYGGATRPPPPR